LFTAPATGQRVVRTSRWTRWWWLYRRLIILIATTGMVIVGLLIKTRDYALIKSWKRDCSNLFIMPIAVKVIISIPWNHKFYWSTNSITGNLSTAVNNSLYYHISN
jgi:hypothetical protein